MNIYRNIDRDKIQFDFLVSINQKGPYTDEIEELGGKIFSVPSRREGLFKNRKGLNEFFREHSEYNIIHQHVSSLSYVAPLKIANKKGVPIRIVHSHSTRAGGNS